MAFILAKEPQAEVIALFDIDPEGDTTVTVRHATGLDEIRLQDMTTRPILSYMLDGFGNVDERSELPPYIVEARKVWCCMVECNILNADGVKLFTPGDEWTRFLTKWNMLPSEARKEIFAATVKVNPHWGN